MRESIIAEKTFNFSVRIVKFPIELCKASTELYPVSKQLLRSATSIGANVEEALGGHSERDFAAKFSIAYKEAREAKYWLRVLQESGIYTNFDFTKELNLLEEILKIIGSILKTTKQKLSKTPNS
jgi:four helix bundle protein